MKSLFSTVTMLWMAMFLLAPLAHAGASEDLAAFKEVQQIKLDAQKELQQKDVEVLRKEIEVVNKRVDDQLAQVGQAVDRFGVLATCISLGITVLLVLGGFLGYRNAKAEAKEAAISQSEETATSWFDVHAQELQKRIAELSEEAQRVRQQMGESLQVVQAHGSANVAAISERSAAAVSMISEAQKDALNRLVERPGSQPTGEQIEAQNTVQALATELEKTGEDSYSFDDWNARAHAAYSKQNWEQAAYFWRRAADVPNAGAANVAWMLFNRAVVQGHLGQHEAAMKTYDELLHRFGDATELALHERVAMALVNKGFTQVQLGQIDDAVNTYDEVMRRFGQISDPSMREWVARALMNKGVSQGQLGQREKAIKTGDEVLRLFGEATEPALREQVAMALNSMGYSRMLLAKEMSIQVGAAGLKEASIQAIVLEALANINQSIQILTQDQKPISGMILGNHAYVQCLLGQVEQAEREFATALCASEFGGQKLYAATLKDLDMYPIEQDQVMRDLVEKAWEAYQKEKSPTPPAQ